MRLNFAASMLIFEKQSVGLLAGNDSLPNYIQQKISSIIQTHADVSLL